MNAFSLAGSAPEPHEDAEENTTTALGLLEVLNSRGMRQQIPRNVCSTSQRLRWRLVVLIPFMSSGGCLRFFWEFSWKSHSNTRLALSWATITMGKLRNWGTSLFSMSWMKQPQAEGREYFLSPVGRKLIPAVSRGRKSPGRAGAGCSELEMLSWNSQMLSQGVFSFWNISILTTPVPLFQREWEAASGIWDLSASFLGGDAAAVE